MNRPFKKPSEDEIDEIVTAEADDDSAWEKPIRVRRPKRLSHRGKFWLLLLLVLAIAFAVVAIPVFLIMPFKPQTERALAISYALKSWSPVVTIIAAIAVLALVARL